MTGFLNSGTAQETDKPFLKYLTWSLLQFVPSPVIHTENAESGTTLRAGLRWQVIPFSYSFNTNKYVSHFQSFFINPVRRFSGSAEIFFQPELTFSRFNNTAGNIWISSGIRTIIPVKSYGEFISFSAGIKYNFRKDINGNQINFPGIETGIYLYGMAGIQANLNFNTNNKINIGLFIKYY